MYQLPNPSVATWGQSGGYHVPTAIDTICPRCRRLVTFSIPTWSGNAVRGMPIAMRCPGCRAEPSLIRLGEANQQVTRLYIDDDPPSRPPVSGLELVPSDAIPDRLKRAYQSALNVLAIGESEATAVTCRRVLEGITAGLLADPIARRRPLAARIKALAGEDKKLAAPLIELSDTLRAGGNLGAHFDDEADTSIEDAERMVDLLDFLISYLFVLPQRVHMFRQEVLGEGIGDSNDEH